MNFRPQNTYELDSGPNDGFGITPKFMFDDFTESHFLKDEKQQNKHIIKLQNKCTITHLVMFHETFLLTNN